MGSVRETNDSVRRNVELDRNYMPDCDPKKGFGNFCNIDSVTAQKPQPIKEEYGPQLPKLPATVAATAATSVVLAGSKKPSDVELFAIAEPDLNRKLENIALKTGVQVSQFLKMATQEAGTRKLSGDYKTAFIKGFLTKFEELNNTRTTKDLAIKTWEYGALVTAGGLSVAIAKEKNKQKFAATGSVTQMFDTNSGPKTPAAVRYAAENQSDYKKLKEICQKNGLNNNSILDAAELNAARMNVADAYKPAYIAGFMSKFLSLAEANGGKISKTALVDNNTALNNAGEQAAAKAVRTGKKPEVVIKPVKINTQLSEASENYKNLINICTLNSIDPKNVLENANLAGREFVKEKDEKARLKLLENYSNSYVAAFLEIAGRSGKVTKEMMAHNYKPLLELTEKNNAIF